MPYVGSLTDIPNKWHLCDGTDGTPNLLDGRFLEGATDIGIFKEPGLPNIKGNTTGGLRMDSGHNGALITSPIIANIGGTLAAGWGNIHLDASLYNPIYRDDINTVQPASYTVYYIIKIK